MKQKTKWNCEECGATGAVEHDEHAGVYQVVEQLRSSHAAVSPECGAGISHMRVENIMSAERSGETR